MSSFAEQVNNAVAAHSQWKVRLRQAIATGSSDFQVNVVGQDNQCTFGKWLYGEGRASFASPEDYLQVRTLHAEFHREAARVLGLATSGKAKEADAAIGAGSAFARASGSLVSKLTHTKAAA